MHIGQPEPGSERDRELKLWEQQGRDHSAPTHVPADVDWQQHGLQPRWLGMESSDCPAALSPGHTHGRGDEEMRRLLAGARQRGELALVLAVIGRAEEDRTRHSLFSADATAPNSTA
ncbi:hypothetical protein [Streptomyces pseudogriseolus]|uniref:hypothetical protein n=1 Tax=Streptomyces pseudogriseolus TaxID=36817 RepID=UPI00347E40DA